MPHCGAEADTITAFAFRAEAGFTRVVQWTDPKEGKAAPTTHETFEKLSGSEAQRFWLDKIGDVEYNAL